MHNPRTSVDVRALHWDLATSNLPAPSLSSATTNEDAIDRSTDKLHADAGVCIGTVIDSVRIRGLTNELDNALRFLPMVLGNGSGNCSKGKSSVTTSRVFFFFFLSLNVKEETLLITH